MGSSLVGGSAFATGHVLTWLAAPPDPLAVTGAWLNLAAVLIVAVIGTHGLLRGAGSGLAASGTALTVVGFALLVGFFTLRVALAHGRIAAEVIEARELVALSAVSNGTLFVGLALLGWALHRATTPVRLGGTGLLLSVAAFLTGLAVPLAGLVGGLLPGGSFVVIARHLRIARRPR